MDKKKFPLARALDQSGSGAEKLTERKPEAVLPDSKVDVLLEELDSFALDYDKFDMGLPMFEDDDNPKEKLRQIVKNWFKKL